MPVATGNILGKKLALLHYDSYCLELNVSNPLKLVVIAAALVVAGVSVAVTPAGGPGMAATMSVEQAVYKAVAEGNLNAVVAKMISCTESPSNVREFVGVPRCSSVDGVAAAMINAGVAPSDAIAALRDAGVPVPNVVLSLRSAIPASDTVTRAQLEVALTDAGLETPAAGNRGNNGNNGNNNPNGNNGNNGGPPPFASSSGNGGGGGGGNASGN